MFRSAPTRWCSATFLPTLSQSEFRRGFFHERESRQGQPGNPHSTEWTGSRECMQEVVESSKCSRFPAEEDVPTVSFVVIGRNEGARLAKCLESIRKVKGIRTEEIIYVDSASTDGSPELASRCGADVIVVRSERPTAALGRNAGWRKAKSDLVLFLDG